MNDVIVRIKELMKYSELNISQTAQKVGISQPNLSSLLSGKRAIGENTINRFVMAFDINKEWLKYGTGEMFIKNKPDMNKSIEKAFEESWLNDYYHGNYKGHAQVGFYAGAEWQEKQSQWISVKDEFPPYNKEVLLLNNRNKTIICQIFNDGYNIKIYCDWYGISYWRLANFPE